MESQLLCKKPIFTNYLFAHSTSQKYHQNAPKAFPQPATYQSQSLLNALHFRWNSLWSKREERLKRDELGQLEASQISSRSVWEWPWSCAYRCRVTSSSWFFALAAASCSTNSLKSSCNFKFLSRSAAIRSSLILIFSWQRVYIKSGQWGTAQLHIFPKDSGNPKKWSPCPV